MSDIFQYTFFALSFLTVACAVMVVLARNPVYSVLYMVMTFFTIAGHFLLMNAQFLAAVHVIVYSGAIMVLFLYVIMMLNLNNYEEKKKSFLTNLLWAIPSGLLLLTLIGAVQGTSDLVTGNGATIGLVENLGRVLFSEFLLPFEISSILFLAGMVGAVYIGKREN